MKKYLILFAKSLALGLGVGLVLAGALGVLYRSLHSGDPTFQPGRVPLYLSIVGGLLGALVGWGMALQVSLEGLLSTLFLRISEKVPVPAAKVGNEWGGKMESVFRQVLEPLPGLVQKFLQIFLVARFSQVDHLNQAVERAKGKQPNASYTPQWYSQVILGYFLRPVKVLFWGTYAILTVVCLILWCLPFLGR